MNENQKLHLKSARIALDATISHLAKASLELRQSGFGRHHGMMIEWQTLIGKLATDSVDLAESEEDSAG